MLKCNWPKWILPWAILPIGLGAAALLFNSDSLESKLGEAAGTQLKSSGSEWASVMMDGRDAKITGEAPDQDAVSKAAQMVVGTYGIRRVDVSGATIAPPVVLDTPTVNKVSAVGEATEITGTWPEGKATTLAVGVAGTTYMLGKDDALTSDGSGNWKLVPPMPIGEGSHDVNVNVTDGKKAEAANTVAGAITVQPAPPVVLDAPTVNKITSVGEIKEITGTWPEGKATTLAVGVAGTTYMLSKDDALTSDGSGNWKLVPPAPLKEGNYDVDVKISDGRNAVAGATTSGAIMVQPAPVAPAQPAIGSVTGENPPVISGTWPEGDGNSLAVALDGKSYKLGAGKQLASDGSGNWTLTPAGKLADGSYDVVATVTSKDNLSSNMTVAGAVTIKTAPPGAPTVDAVAGFANTPTATGTWPEGDGNSLAVSLAGKAYKLGTDRQLSSDGSGKWSLTPSGPLADGSYDIVASVTSTAGKVSEATAAGAIKVDTTPPAAPTVNQEQGRSIRPSVTGTWPESDSKKLTVEINKKTYTLGKDAGLASDGSGNWTLKLDEDLADNTYDVVATATDEAGNSATDRGFGEIVVDASAPAVPTVNTLLTRLRQPVITGAWPSRDAESLKVSIGSKAYEAGAGDGLTTEGDNWTLRISENLADGTYNVAATATDKAGNIAVDASEGELVVDATPPGVPTVNPYKSEFPRPLLSGKFPEGDAATMAVTFDGQSYAMGSSSQLSSDGKGNWSILTSKDYAPGKYDVKVIVADKAGNQRSDATTDEVEVVAPPKPAEPAPAPAVVAGPDCQKLFDEAIAGEEVRFASAKARILSESDGLLDKLADVIKQCPDEKVEIGGHTDASGSTSYNQALSERRANAVRDALIGRGANADNLSSVGYGESRPIADNKTKEGRAKNRRTEFKVQN
jgi:outer membrane protein OmpA-like peptidoglycan-associated protein